MGAAAGSATAMKAGQAPATSAPWLGAVPRTLSKHELQ
jgi:hypothetical protein